MFPDAISVALLHFGGWKVKEKDAKQAHSQPSDKRGHILQSLDLFQGLKVPRGRLGGENLDF